MTARPSPAPIPTIVAATSLLLLGVPAAHAQDIFDLPAAWKYDPGSEDAAKPGFFGRINQQAEDFFASIGTGNGMLNRLPDESNLVVMVGNPDIGTPAWTGDKPVETDGSFVYPGVINFHADGFGEPSGLIDGNLDLFNEFSGHPDQFFPGFPGAIDEFGGFYENGSNFTIEFSGWIELPAGTTELGVHNANSIELSFAPNDPRDIFARMVVLQEARNSGRNQKRVIVDVEEAGLYAFRLMMNHGQGQGEAALELFSFNETTFEDVLVNDSGGPDPGSLKSFQALTVPGRPYVSAVSPPPSETGVALDSPVTATFHDLGGEVPTVRFGGAEVTPAFDTDGTVTTMTFTPALAGATTYEVELTYGGLTGTWSFSTLSERKALLISSNTGADVWIKGRLGQLGFTVNHVDHDSNSLDDTEGVELIYISSTVASNKVRGEGMEDLPIPMIIGESANANDYFLLDSFGAAVNDGGTRSLYIEDNTHPITQGLPLGDVEIFTTNIVTHSGSTPIDWTPPGTLLATHPSAIANSPLDGQEKGVLYVLEAGTEVDFGFLTLEAPRAFWGPGDNGSDNFTPAGEMLFDNLVNYLTGSGDGGEPSEVEITRYDRDAANGDFTIFWTSEAGRSYTIEFSGDLSGPPWANLEDNFAATGDETSYTDSGAGGNPARYYRVRENAAP